MLFSQMSPDLRERLLGVPENFPLRVTFLGKGGLLTQEEVDFLRRQDVDFDVDDRQIAEILPEVEQTGAFIVQSPEGARLAPVRPFILVAALLAFWLAIKRVGGMVSRLRDRRARL